MTSKSVNFFTPFALNLRRIIHKFNIKFVDSSPFYERLVNDKNAVIASLLKQKIFKENSAKNEFCLNVFC